MSDDGEARAVHRAYVTLHVVFLIYSQNMVTHTHTTHTHAHTNKRKCSHHVSESIECRLHTSMNYEAKIESSVIL